LKESTDAGRSASDSRQPLGHTPARQPEHQQVIEVRRQETRQRHVPAQPEIDDIRGF